MKTDYTKEDLNKEFGKIYSVNLINYDNKDVLDFIDKIKKIPNPTQLARRKIIKEHGEEIKEIYLKFKQEYGTIDLCSKCSHSSENKYDVEEWICWRDWNSVRKKYNYKKESVSSCQFFSKMNDGRFYVLLEKELKKKILGIPVEARNLQWLLKDLKLIEFESGWEKANRKSKSFERCVYEDFEQMGFNSHSRWIKINCSKGIKLLQLDCLFTDEYGNAFLIEVKNNYIDAGIPQIIKYWKLLQKIRQFQDLVFTLFIVSFHEVVNKYGEQSAILELQEVDWQTDYFLANTKNAPSINFVLGQYKYQVNV